MQTERLGGSSASEGIASQAWEGQFNLPELTIVELGIVAHTYNPSTTQTETGRSLVGQPP